MATVIASSILSPLGLGADDTLDAILARKSGLRRYAPSPELPFEYTASMFGECMRAEGFSRFESLALASISQALQEHSIPLGDRTVLILSSTKGNIGDYDGNGPSNDILLPASALKLSKTIGLTSTPLTVCNACVSGVSALMLANRLLNAGEYDYAICCGAEVLSPFIISGFNSLKALDKNECRPFDIERLGLNLGEAAATIILKANDECEGWKIKAAASRNDGLHITNPSPQGEGCMQAILALDANKEDLALINAHGTATMFNDQMESKAIERAGLSCVPVNALKGYIGHTMGAAGIVETIITMKAIDRGLAIGTRGFSEIGVSGKINLVRESLPTDKKSFLKIISGFGGCNCAILLSRKSNGAKALCPPIAAVRHVRITPADGPLTEIYKSKINDYPKYYKMDSLSRLAFVAAELLLQCEGDDRLYGSCTRPVVFFSNSGSIRTDSEYISTFSDKDNFFPSPSLFVYTLPNISAGEVAIRNKYHAETLMVLLPRKDAQAMHRVNLAMLSDPSASSLISGWIDYIDDQNYEADLYLINKSI